MKEKSNKGKGVNIHLLRNKDDNNESCILKDFNIGKTLGKGTFGKVKLGIHEITGEKVIN